MKWDLKLSGFDNRRCTLAWTPNTMAFMAAKPYKGEAIPLKRPKTYNIESLI